MPTPHGLRFSASEKPSSNEFIDVLRRSTLAERRPVDDPATIDAMLVNADILITVWDGGKLIGISRAISDFAYCTYLSELAVDTDYQGRGVGKELIRRTHVAGGAQAALVLLAAPAAESYYPHVGMKKHESCWMIPRSA